MVVSGLTIPVSLDQRTSHVMWQRSRIGVQMEVFRHPVFLQGPDEWRILEVEVGILKLCTHTITIIVYRQATTLVVTCGLSCYAIREYTLRVDRDLVDVLLVREGEKVSLCI